MKFKKAQSYYLSKLTFYMILARTAWYGWYDSWNNGFLGLAFSTRPTFRLSSCGFSVLSTFSRFEKIHLWVYQSCLREKVRYLKIHLATMLKGSYCLLLFCCHLICVCGNRESILTKFQKIFNIKKKCYYHRIGPLRQRPIIEVDSLYEGHGSWYWIPEAVIAWNLVLYCFYLCLNGLPSYFLTLVSIKIMIFAFFCS